MWGEKVVFTYFSIWNKIWAGSPAVEVVSFGLVTDRNESLAGEGDGCAPSYVEQTESSSGGSNENQINTETENETDAFATAGSNNEEAIVHR